MTSAGNWKRRKILRKTERRKVKLQRSEGKQGKKIR